MLDSCSYSAAYLKHLSIHISPFVGSFKVGEILTSHLTIKVLSIHLLSVHTQRMSHSPYTALQVLEIDAAVSTDSSIFIVPNLEKLSFKGSAHIENNSVLTNLRKFVIDEPYTSTWSLLTTPQLKLSIGGGCLSVFLFISRYQSIRHIKIGMYEGEEVSFTCCIHPSI